MRELTYEEMEQVDGGLGPLAFGAVMEALMAQFPAMTVEAYPVRSAVSPWARSRAFSEE